MSFGSRITASLLSRRPDSKQVRACVAVCSPPHEWRISLPRCILTACNHKYDVNRVGGARGPLDHCHDLRVQVIISTRYWGHIPIFTSLPPEYREKHGPGQLSAEAYAVFYAGFLDTHRQRHSVYNWAWWKEVCPCLSLSLQSAPFPVQLGVVEGGMPLSATPTPTPAHQCMPHTRPQNASLLVLGGFAAKARIMRQLRGMGSGHTLRRGRHSCRKISRNAAERVWWQPPVLGPTLLTQVLILQQGRRRDETRPALSNHASLIIRARAHIIDLGSIRPHEKRKNAKCIPIIGCLYRSEISPARHWM
jgi:hypothetical protein